MCHINCLTQLQNLGFAFCERTTDEELQHVNYLVQLQNIDLNYCNK